MIFIISHLVFVQFTVGKFQDFICHYLKSTFEILGGLNFAIFAIFWALNFVNLANQPFKKCKNS